MRTCQTLPVAVDKQRVVSMNIFFKRSEHKRFESESSDLVIRDPVILYFITPVLDKQASVTLPPWMAALFLLSVSCVCLTFRLLCVRNPLRSFSSVFTKQGEDQLSHSTFDSIRVIYPLLTSPLAGGGTVWLSFLAGEELYGSLSFCRGGTVWISPFLQGMTGCVVRLQANPQGNRTPRRRPSLRS